MKHKKLLAIPAVLVAGLLLTASSCTGETSGDESEREFTESQQRSYNKAQPPHAYDASQARENLIAAHDAMAQGATSWTVQYVEGVGVTFECPSLGYPLPFGSQLTNPEKIAWDNGGGNVTLPQMEPYGVYIPADVPATLANCVLPNGDVGVFYSEPALTTFGFDVKCDAERKRCEIPSDSKATVKVSKVKANKRDAPVSEEEQGKETP